MAGRQYDYASPTFGGFSVPPPSWDRPSSRGDNSYRSSNRQALVKQASITSALSRSDSAGKMPIMSRVDSLSRSPLARADSNPRVPVTLTRQDSGPRSPLARQDSGSSRFEVPPPVYRSPYVDRFRNFNLM